MLYKRNNWKRKWSETLRIPNPKARRVLQQINEVGSKV